MNLEFVRTARTAWFSRCREPQGGAHELLGSSSLVFTSEPLVTLPQPHTGSTATAQTVDARTSESRFVAALASDKSARSSAAAILGVVTLAIASTTAAAAATIARLSGRGPVEPRRKALAGGIAA